MIHTPTLTTIKSAWLRWAVKGERAPVHPKRYTKIGLTISLEGPRPEHRGKVDRAIGLSGQKFCSVVHSLHPDIPLEIEVQGV